ncbi:hypothetical protein EDD36DRAFT_466642 [Exophiala viscosa]|uniref:G-protein coupled receptors family 2 profile 2 domain-containing protein n=1 Tax=Exophiala viscosa TaxID=2486360 RepID=A0AAN6DU68_9EURO|nr:hypothetical protein EDD36DRAFT_466642 [Exophiala viscosa]
MTEYHKSFTPSQLRSLDVVARTSACLSLTGASFTIISFVSYPPLRKPVNRLAFSIAISNIFGCLAYSWGRHPINAGRNSAWCQTQGMFITWFVMTDPILVMVLAFNVLLTVRTKRNAHELKKIDFYGIGFAFVAPFIPALVFLCWRPDGRTVYGDATLWCWIAKESNILRLVEFYVPIWTMIFISICLFALSGKRVLRVRKKLKSAQSSQLNSADEDRPTSPTRERHFSTFARSFMSRTTTSDSGPSPNTGQSTTKAQPDLKGLEPLGPIHSHEKLDTSTVEPQTAPQSPILNRETSKQSRTRNRTASRFDKIHWKYAKFAFLCTVVLFITWIPISVNRVYNSFINPNHQIYGLYLASAACIPLHGFGNFIIYTTTSWTECHDFITGCASRSTSASFIKTRSSRWGSSVQFREPNYGHKARAWSGRIRTLGLGRKHLEGRQSAPAPV